MRTVHRLLAVVAAVLATASVARAQDVIPAGVTADKLLSEPKAPQGWVPKLTFGATGSYNDSRHVVGAADGATVQLGAILDGAGTYRTGQSVLEGSLKIAEAQTRTPQIPMFLKSSDLLGVVLTYSYRLPAADWVGPYARLGANSPLFSGYTGRASSTWVVKTDRDGTVQPGYAVSARSKIALTDPFEPLVVTESAGAFANPVTSKELAVKLKLGVGGQHILVRNGYIVTADKGTSPDPSAQTELDLKQLENSTQAGGLFEGEAAGALAENIGWTARASFFYPFATSVNTKLSGIDLLNTELGAKLSVHLAKWLSLDYGLSAKKLPLITGKTWQIQNGVILTAGFDLI